MIGVFGVWLVLGFLVVLVNGGVVRGSLLSSNLKDSSVEFNGLWCYMVVIVLLVNICDGVK